jgi:hypothetical protein
MKSSRILLIAGDVLAIGILTLIGFATHDEVNTSFLPRMAAMFIPLLIGWFLLAPALGLFELESIREPRQIWRPVLAGFFAAQLAVVLRGYWLGGVVLPLFGLILGGSAALGMLLWRGVWLLISRKSR